MNFTKRVFLGLLALCLLLSMASCAKASQPPTAPDNSAALTKNISPNTAESVPTEKTLYTEHSYLLPAGCSVRGVSRLGSNLLIFGHQNGSPVLAVFNLSFSEDGIPSFSQVRQIQMDTQSPYYTMIYGICAGEDGYFYVVSGEHPLIYMSKGELCYNDAYTGITAITKLTSEGDHVDKMEIPNWHADSILGIAADSDSRIYIMGADYVSSFSWQSNEITNTQNPDSSMCSIASAENGAIVSVLEWDKYKYYLVDGKGALAELPIENPSDKPTVEVGNFSKCQGLDGEYIVSANSCFLEFDLESKETTLLYQWDYTSFPGGCEYACRLSENFFACTVGEDFLLITGMVEKAAGEKRTVNVAVYDMERSNIGGIITQMNLSGGDYRYESIEYTADQETQLLADIITGGKIDLIVFNNNLDTHGSAFEDLYTYIDADTELGRDSFIPGILNALENNGQLHEIWEGVMINTLAARQRDVEGKSNLRPQDYEDMLSANEQYKAVFQAFMDRENLLKWVCEVALAKYVDYPSATCSFNDPSFSDLLEWCGMMGNPIKEGDDSSAYDLSQIILSLEIISDPLRLKAISDNFGEPYSFVGFPDGGQGTSYFSCGYNGSMAIPTTSSNKAGAWEFIKDRLSMEAQIGINYAIPVNQSAMQRQAEAVLSETEVQQLLGLLSSTAISARCRNQQIMDIIFESGRAYLAGDKGLNETVDMIQAKVSIYLSEQGG